MKVCRLLGRLSPLNAPRTILALILLLVLSTPASSQAIAVLVDALDLDEMASLELPGLG